MIPRPYQNTDNKAVLHLLPEYLDKYVTES